MAAALKRGAAGPSSLEEVQQDIQMAERALQTAVAEHAGQELRTAAVLLVLLLQQEARSDRHMSSNAQQVHDSCTSLCIPPQACAGLPASQQTAGSPQPPGEQATPQEQLRECCEVLSRALGEATASELAAVLRSLYLRRLQMQAVAPLQKQGQAVDAGCLRGLSEGETLAGTPPPLQAQPRQQETGTRQGDAARLSGTQRQQRSRLHQPEEARRLADDWEEVGCLVV